MDSPIPASAANQFHFLRVPHSPNLSVSESSVAPLHFDLPDSSIPHPLQLFPLPYELTYPRPVAYAPVAQQASGHSRTHAKKRGPRKRQLTEEQRQAKVSERMERNRMTARDNRQKRKDYVRSLEDRIQVLTSELDDCKKRLAHHEAVSQIQQCKDFAEFCTRMKQHAQKFEEQHLRTLADVMQRSRLNIPEAIPMVRSAIELKKRALDVLCKTLLEFSVPIPHRFFMYLAEHGEDPPAEESSESRQGAEEDKEAKTSADTDMKNLDAIIAQVQEDGRRILAEMPDVRKHLQKTAAQLRVHISRYVQAYESITEEVSSLDYLAMEKLVSMMNPRHMRDFAKWVQAVMEKGGMGGQGELFSAVHPGFTLTVIEWPFKGVRAGRPGRGGAKCYSAEGFSGTPDH